MVEVRNEICSICGWSKIIVVREQIRRKAPSVGIKEILVCKDCQAVRGTPPFDEYYKIALRGTIYEGQDFVMARKKPKSLTDMFSPAASVVRSRLADAAMKQVINPLTLMDADAVERAAKEADLIQRARNKQHMFELLSPEMQAFVRVQAYRMFFVGIVMGSAFVASILGILFTIGVFK